MNMNSFERAEKTEHEKIELIENAELSTSKRLDLMLFALGEKPALQLGDYDVIESDKHKQELIAEFSEEMATIKNLLENLRCSYEITKDLEDRDGIMGFSFLVSRDQAELARVAKADADGDDKTFGEMMGYPKTAIDAYGTADAFDYRVELSQEELKALEDEGVIPFLEFMPSKQHWDEELAWARKMKDLVKEKSPTFYGTLIAESK